MVGGSGGGGGGGGGGGRDGGGGTEGPRELRWEAREGAAGRAAAVMAVMDSEPEDVQMEAASFLQHTDAHFKVGSKSERNSRKSRNRSVTVYD
eukprot:3587918-Pyramimonas_sp.AAC.1